MIIKTLVINPDGSQTNIDKEYPASWADNKQNTGPTDIDMYELALDHEFRLTLLEVGVI